MLTGSHHIISDLHSNLQAIEWVLATAPKYDVVWNLGDTVGYGANPNEVVNRVRKLGGIVIRGNHDRICTGNVKFGEYRDLSQLALFAANWTQKILSAENTKWLSHLPRGPVRPLGRKVACVHGSPWNEDEYVIFKEDAWAAFRMCRARIILFGHTHRQVGWAKNGRGLTLLKPVFEPDCADQFIIQLQKSNRYLLNPGSVGQPRDGDWRASFAIYDDAELSWTWCRAPYDFRAAQRRIRSAGLPDELATRLRDGS